MSKELTDAIDLVEVFLDQEADFLAENCDEECVDEEREQLAAIRTVLTTAKRFTWQPMDTAPRNGTEVLLAVKGGQVVVAHWMPGGHCIEDHPPIAQGWYYFNGSYFRDSAQPLFWMPLPACLT